MGKLKSKKTAWVIVLWGLLTPFSSLVAQQLDPPRKLVDFILAVVGDQVVLRSEFEAEVEQLKESGEVVITEELRCMIFQEMLQRKLLVHQAEIDSVPVSTEQVEDELNRRLGYFASQMGGEKKLEEYLGKTLTEYKREMRPKMRQQLLTKAMEARVSGDMKVNPSEVREYFNKIPGDSIPLIKAEFEIGQIIIKPNPSELAKEYAKASIQKIRDDIVLRGADFSRMARNFSEDKYSGERGGSLGEFGRGDMVPAFERAAFKLQKDSISQIIETQFGYHIIKLIERRGEKVEAQHILVRPKLTSYDINDAKALADSIRDVFMKDSSLFCELAMKFSDDEYTKGNCGLLSDPQTGASKISIEYLDREMLSVVSRMRAGELSAPQVIDLPDGTKAVRMLYLKSEIPPHKANLKDDYPRIQLAALEDKRQKAMEEWVLKKIKGTHIDINREYFDCEFITEWNRIISK